MQRTKLRVYQSPWREVRSTFQTFETLSKLFCWKYGWNIYLFIFFLSFDYLSFSNENIFWLSFFIKWRRSRCQELVYILLGSFSPSRCTPCGLNFLCTSCRLTSLELLFFIFMSSLWIDFFRITCFFHFYELPVDRFLLELSLNSFFMNMIEF